MAKEFSIEIPDKEADAIHSGMSSRLAPHDLLALVLTVLQSTRL